MYNLTYFFYLKVGDDWDHTVLLQNYGQVPMIKGQYPQHERFNWWWYSTTDQTILQLRNPRDALPSYRSMKNEIDYQTTWFNVHQHVGRTYTFRTSTASWNEFLNHLGYFKLLIRQWAWQIDFYMERGESEKKGRRVEVKYLCSRSNS